MIASSLTTMVEVHSACSRATRARRGPPDPLDHPVPARRAWRFVTTMTTQPGSGRPRCGRCPRPRRSSRVWSRPSYSSATRSSAPRHVEARDLPVLVEHLVLHLRRRQARAHQHEPDPRSRAGTRTLGSMRAATGSTRRQPRSHRVPAAKDRRSAAAEIAGPSEPVGGHHRVGEPVRVRGRRPSAVAWSGPQIVERHLVRLRTAGGGPPRPQAASGGDRRPRSPPAAPDAAGRRPRGAGPTSP